MDSSILFIINTFKTGGITEDQFQILTEIYKSLTSFSLSDAAAWTHFTEFGASDFKTITDKYISTGKITQADLDTINAIDLTKVKKIIPSFDIYMNMVKLSMTNTISTIGGIIPSDETKKIINRVNTIFIYCMQI